MFTLVKIYNYIKNLCYIKVTGDFCFKWKPSHAYHKIDTFLHRAKMNGTQRRALVIRRMYRGMAKDTSWAKLMSNSSSQ